jgi:glycosidase
MWLLDTLPYYIKEAGMDNFFDDDFEYYDGYNDFDDQDSFYDDDIDNDMDEISNGEGSGYSEKSRTGLDWYELAFLGGLAEELSEEKRKRQLRREKDRNNPKHKS